MDLFHGTNITGFGNLVDATSPPNKVDVTLGGGELGQGFYVGTDPVMAAALARGKFKRSAAVIQFNVNNAALLSLNNVVLRRRALIYQSWRHLINRQQRNTFLYNTDLVIGPYALFDFSKQYKFESKRAESVINASPTIQIL